jgi:tRNA-2-methylthio-N6-dimethylallyladenosine synthase
MKHKKIYINTIGCQMNVYDSDVILKRLESLGYLPASSADEADLIIANTCAIREKAEQKAFSFIGRLNKLKKKKPHLIVGVGGCVAQQEGHTIMARMPHVDLVFGTHALDRLPAAVSRIERDRCRIVDVALSDAMDEIDSVPNEKPAETVSKFITIMRGCDNFCTYCVVPFVRGAEVSRNPRRIMNEIRAMVRQGVKEVTLLGQNVNSYGIKEGLCAFPDLLKQINEIEGLQRIRFTTSHPKDFSDDLIAAFGTIEKLCRHIHLPVQSGSDAILKRMNRKYTSDRYLKKVNKLREIYPGIAITTDIIVGFPGETAEDFRRTLNLIEKVKFDSLFAFKYSDRPNAPARRFPGKVKETDKDDRLQELLNVQSHITLNIHERMKGRVESVLVEGFSKRQGDLLDSNEGEKWTGRTSCNKVVNFVHSEKVCKDDKPVTMGDTADVLIEEALPHSLRGRVVQTHSGCSPLKGDESYAA